MDGGLVYERKPVPADEGDDWLYYEPPTKKWYRVALLVVPEEAQRIRIQHLDSGMKGKAEWVPVKRLRVPWPLRERYHATNAAWDRLYGHDPEDAARDAADHVLMTLLDESIATMLLNSAAMEIHDLPALSRIVKVDETELTAHPDTISEEGITYVPWSVTSRVVQSLCIRDPAPIVEYLDAEERELRERELTQLSEGGAWYDDESYDDDRFALRARRWRVRGAEMRQILRQWVDAESPGVSQKYQQLRNRYVELTLALLPALDQLSRIRSKKSDQIAAEIREIIEKPVP